MSHQVKALVVSGAVEILVSCLLGLVMLIMMQPWGAGLARRGPKLRDLGSVHLDLLMLAFLQFAAAFLLHGFGLSIHPALLGMLMAGCWLNPMPYLARGYGINAFVLGGPPRQVALALVGLASVVALTVSWGAMVILVASEFFQMP